MGNSREWEIEREIAALDGLSLAVLRRRWRDQFGVAPPSKIRAGLLRRALAYRLQEDAFGGLTPNTKRELRRIAKEARIGRPRPGGRRSAGNATLPEIEPKRRKPFGLSLGTRLVREWNGTTEIVDVLPNGFGWRGRTFRTLSAVAAAITGTHWSGPKFFGLSGPQVGERLE